MWIENLIYVENLGEIVPNKKYWYDKIVEKHLSYQYKLANNFCLDEDFRQFGSILIKKFHQVSNEQYSKVFGNFRLNEKNKNYCWAYVSNESDYRGGIHHHLHTSTINSVFYFNVPDTLSGGITFYRNSGEKYLTYYPKNNDLIIFPNFLLHDPEKSLESEYRISINMEIICDFLNEE
jgi:hypothetical protein